MQSLGDMCCQGATHRREEFRFVFSVAPVARPWNKPLSGDSGYLRPGIYLVKTLHGVGAALECLVRALRGQLYELLEGAA